MIDDLLSSRLVSSQDDYPLASLPLLGYSVTVPSESENIHKDYVFKLHFKSHVYYFRSESEYTFERYGEQWSEFEMHLCLSDTPYFWGWCREKYSIKYRFIGWWTHMEPNMC